MEKMLRDPRTIILMVAPALIVFLLFIPFPAVVSVLLSLTRWNLIGTIRFIGLENYRFMFVDDHVFLIAMRNTLYFVALSAVLQLPMAFFLANILARPLRGRNVFRNIIFLPVTFSGVAVSLMFYFVYHPGVGLINQLMRIVNPEFRVAFLADPGTALTSVIVSLAWQWTGYHMVIFLAGIAVIPSELFEAARIDGASELQITGRIIFPLTLPVLQVSAVLITTSSLKSFDQIYIMTFGGPNYASEVLASHMYTKTFAQMQYGYGSTISTLLMVLCIVATVAITAAFRRGIRGIA